jgi:hypothetical protein
MATATTSIATAKAGTAVKTTRRDRIAGDEVDRI